VSRQRIKGASEQKIAWAGKAQMAPCGPPWLAIVLLVLFTAFILSASGCAEPKASSAATESSNPAATRMAALAGIPPSDDLPPAAVMPNPAPFVDSATLAAANLEANTLKILIRGFLAEHPTSRTVASDEVSALYSGGPPRARYYFDPVSARIVAVDSVPGGWTGIVFSLQKQGWGAGSPDNDRAGDQDTP
jgi:hypothetical protein